MRPLYTIEGDRERVGEREREGKKEKRERRG